MQKKVKNIDAFRKKFEQFCKLGRKTSQKCQIDQRVDCTLAWFLHVTIDSVYRRSGGLRIRPSCFFISRTKIATANLRS